MQSKQCSVLVPLCEDKLNHARASHFRQMCKARITPTHCRQAMCVTRLLVCTIPKVIFLPSSFAITTTQTRPQSEGDPSSSRKAGPPVCPATIAFAPPRRRHTQTNMSHTHARGVISASLFGERPHSPHTHTNRRGCGKTSARAAEVRPFD